jgi:hypothetical protein
LTSHRIPRSTEQATAMLERYAAIAADVATIEGQRAIGISHANATADTALEPLLAEQAEIREKLEPWWARAAPELTKGKRKSIELGGCMIGTRAGRDSLGMATDIEPVIAWLEKRDWAKDLLITKVSIDKSATLKALDGQHKRYLAMQGFSRVEGGVTFFINRAEQEGTRA